MSKLPVSVDPGKARNRQYDPATGVQRVSNAGFSWTPLGAATAAVLVGQMTPVMVYSATAAFVAFGPQSVAAPTSAANGLPVPAGIPVFYNSGPNQFVIGSASGVFVYSADLEISQLATPPSQYENTQEDLTGIPANERFGLTTP